MAVIVLLSVFSILPIFSNSELVPNDHLNVRNVSRIPDTFLVNNENLRFIAVGDWGYGHHHQQEVADAMGIWCQDEDGGSKCDFIISNGDNFYSDGVTSVHDEQFVEKWKNVYTHPSIANLPWYLTVGNHDHHTHNGEWYQVQYSEIEPRWHFPDLAYAFKYSTPSVSMTIVSIDTESIESDKNDPQSMITLLDEELKNAGKEDWKIVFAHHPIYSGGHHYGSEIIEERILSIMKNYDVDFYLSGHDHNLQHWVQQGGVRGIDHVTSGAGGKSEYDIEGGHLAESEERGGELRFFDKHYGFVYFVVSQDEINVQFVNDASGHFQVLYEFTRSRY